VPRRREREGAGRRLVFSRGPGAAGLVVGIEESVGEQGAHVGAAEPVDDGLPVALTFDQPGEAQLDRCWLATVGRHVAIAARVATSRRGRSATAKKLPWMWKLLIGSYSRMLIK